VKASDVSENTYFLLLQESNYDFYDVRSAVQTVYRLRYLDYKFLCVIMNIEANEKCTSEKKDVHSCTLDCSMYALYCIALTPSYVWSVERKNTESL